MVENINYFDGNIKSSICRGHISLERFIEANRNPAKPVAALLKQIAKASELGDRKLKQQLKTSLPYFVISCVIPTTRRRKYESISKFTGYMQIDIDGIKNPRELKAMIWEELPQLYCAYLSPSGHGVKAIMKIPIVKSIEEYKEYFLGIEQWFEEMGIDGFDHCAFNAILPLYLSHDPNILYRKEPETWTIKGELLKPENTKNLNPKPKVHIATGNELDYKSPAYFARITKEIFINKINDITGTPGHTRMRSAALVLGTRVGAGYISKSEAVELAEQSINSNSYLRKDLSGYIKTSVWAINMGAVTPKYYD